MAINNLLLFLLLDLQNPVILTSTAQLFKMVSVNIHCCFFIFTCTLLSLEAIGLHKFVMHAFVKRDSLP